VNSMPVLRVAWEMQHSDDFPIQHDQQEVAWVMLIWCSLEYGEGEQFVVLIVVRVFLVLMVTATIEAATERGSQPRPLASQI